MEDIISAAKAEFIRAKDRIRRDIDATPDDKLNWSPSPSARTPLHQVAHAAMGVDMMKMLQGQPFPWASMAEMDTALRQMEQPYTTRASVIELLDVKTGEFMAFLDSMTPEQLGSMASFPMMQIPMAIAITIPADHVRCHASQLEYMQTIYGDYTMHGM